MKKLITLMLLLFSAHLFAQEVSVNPDGTVSSTASAAQPKAESLDAIDYANKRASDWIHYAGVSLSQNKLDMLQAPAYDGQTFQSLDITLGRYLVTNRIGLELRLGSGGKISKFDADIKYKPSIGLHLKRFFKLTPSIESTVSMGLERITQQVISNTTNDSTTRYALLFGLGFGWELRPQTMIELSYQQRGSFSGAAIGGKTYDSKYNAFVLGLTHRY